MSQVLRDARRFEEEKGALIPPESRPAFHLSARVGWMNDPNGFSYYNGLYHLFYQYHPYDSHWGPMHWGHAVSRDLLHWTHRPAALAPDSPCDRDGCFSGSAMTLEDGRHLLMYTGIVRSGAAWEAPAVQTQNLAFGDGEEYEKYAGNPVLTEADLPEGGSRYDFRDPKVWQMPDGSYRALVANDFEQDSASVLSGMTGEPIEGLDEGGRMLLYRSDDLIHWEFVRVFAENHGRLGLMWECPDFFELDGQYVLLGSAQDMLSQGLEYHNGNGTFCLFGDYDPEEERFTEKYNQAIDYGIDFYAPQTVLTPDGRRVMIGWMQNWDTCNLRTPSTPWFGQMSLPRELFIRDGRLCQRPVKEFDELRHGRSEVTGGFVKDGEIELPGINGRPLDMTVTVRMDDPETAFSKFAVRFAKNDRFYTSVSYRPQEETLKIDRKFSGSRRAIIHQRRAKVLPRDGQLKLRIILDRFSAEVFVNDGEKVMTATLYTDPAADRVAFFASGSAKFDVEKYDII